MEMSIILRRHRTFIIILLVDLFLYWLLFCSGIVLPFINPSVEIYEQQITSAPRNTNQIILWYLLQIPFIIYSLIYTLKLVLNARRS
ncbi:hypothetical protein RJG79_07875 [Mycoplasmatota bacterium WC44]